MTANQASIASGVAVLVLGAVLLARSGRVAALRALALGGLCGAVAYPLALCTFMGLASTRGTNFAPDQAPSRFRSAFATYARSAPGEAAPRGAALGVAVVACRIVARRAARGRHADPANGR